MTRKRGGREHGELWYTQHMHVSNSGSDKMVMFLKGKTKNRTVNMRRMKNNQWSQTPDDNYGQKGTSTES